MVKTKKGFIGIIFIIICVAVFVVWFAYLWNKNWFGGRLNISNDGLNINTKNAETPKSIDGQLNDLRQDVKALQDKKDKEIFDELNK